MSSEQKNKSGEDSSSNYPDDWAPRNSFSHSIKNRKSNNRENKDSYRIIRATKAAPDKGEDSAKIEWE